MNRTLPYSISLVVVVLAGAIAFAQSPAAPAKRMNVLFIMSDDLKPFLGCYGDQRARTPHIDRLAARGMRFDRAYCQFPLCGPSRNSMLTGLYPNTTGILTNGQVFRQTLPDQVSLPQLFRQAGYFAGRIGKMYHYNVPNSVGTNGHDDPASWELEINPAGVDRLVDLADTFSVVPGEFGGSLSWYASPNPEAEHTDAMEAADAEWVLERCAKQKDRPFFLGVGFFRPHTPYIAPRDPYFGLYPKNEMPIVQGVEEDQADMPAAALESLKAEEVKLTDDQRRQVLQAYYASISFMDAQVGRVVAALDRLGLADDTIIVFTSDHGYHMGEHGLWQKRSLFEHAARVPLLIVAPGKTKGGAVAKAPVGLVDLYATLAELCGLEAPANVQGQSLVPILQDASALGRGWALTQVARGGPQRVPPTEPFHGYSLRTPEWRYTEWDEGRHGRELYDHRVDPMEMTNLAKDPAHGKTVQELSKQLREAIKESTPANGAVPKIRPKSWGPVLSELPTK